MSAIASSNSLMWQQAENRPVLWMLPLHPGQFGVPQRTHKKEED